MKPTWILAALLTLPAFFLLAGGVARAQAPRDRFEVGAHLAATSQQELDRTDVGFGGWLGFDVTRVLSVEGEVSFYPSDAPAQLPVSSSRLEGLFGIKAGPRFDRFAIFGKARPGFVRFAGAPGPVACILIYPPPLDCVLAQGQTVLALDLGGGLEIYPSRRTVVRVDVSDLLLRYSGPAIRRAGEAVNEDRFWGGNFRLTVGAAFRF